MTLEKDTVTIMAHLGFANPVDDAVRRALAEVRAATVREAGCLEYNAHLHAEDPCRVSFYERWRDHAAFEAHLASPHLAAFIAAVGGLLAAPPEVARMSRLG